MKTKRELRQRREANRRYREAHPDRAKVQGERWGKKHPDLKKAAHKAMRVRWREEAIAAYGGKCACCGETQSQFLAIDHIDGGGNRERKMLGITAGTPTVAMLRRKGWPKGYRVLCHNCNASIGYYGYCPHKRILG